ncbi:MAG: DUF1499 domain-containing protein [Longimicrobiales bacterium]
MTAIVALAVLAVLLVLLAGPGSRFGVWHFRTGFTLLRWGAMLGAGTAALAIVALIWTTATSRAGRGGAVIALILGAAAFVWPWRLQREASGYPPIHDITADMSDPPRFEAVLPLRAEASNPAEYGGPETAAQQREAYPDIRPLRMARPPAQAFELALAAARDMGWEIVASDEADGRIEATATTTWFGFEDDVVVRVSPAGDGSRIDVRSVSRVGRGDVGANAKRVRAYIDRLESLAADA